MSVELRIIETDTHLLGTSFGIHEVIFDEKGNITDWKEDSPSVVWGESVWEMGEYLVKFNEAMLKPVLEIVKDEDGKETLQVAKNQPNIGNLPQSDHWRKAVIYYRNKSNKIIDHRRDTDKLYWIKIRDYVKPIAAFKAVDDVVFPFYYVARGDGLIVATYTDCQVIKEQLIEPDF